MALGRLWRAQSKHEDARRLAAETYDSFAEGLDTLDLKDVRRCSTNLPDRQPRGLRRAAGCLGPATHGISRIAKLLPLQTSISAGQLCTFWRFLLWGQRFASFETPNENA